MFSLRLFKDGFIKASTRSLSMLNSSSISGNNVGCRLQSTPLPPPPQVANLGCQLQPTIVVLPLAQQIINISVPSILPTNINIEDSMKRIQISDPLPNQQNNYHQDGIVGDLLNYTPNAEPMELPTHNKQYKKDGIQAAVLIGIRRRKMKKHKLRKLRKKMKFEWAKVRQRRELRKEKAFQAVLITQIKEAEQFSAEKYVEEKIQKANEIPIPRYWKGKRLPQFVIKELLGIK